MLGRFANKLNNRRWFPSLRLSDEPISLPNLAAIVPWEREHRSDPNHKAEGCYFCRLPDRAFTAADRAKLTRLHNEDEHDATA
jgi:hypothetical protein